MELVLAGLHWSTCLVYLDDIIIYSRNTEKHFKRLQEVLERLRTAGLKLKPSKCYLFQKSVHYLGHIISEHGVETDPQKIQCVKEWPIPTCTEEMQQFLGLATYYRKFVKNFAQIAAPLYCLTEKKKTWIWNEESEVAFDTLKKKLTSAPILAFQISRSHLFWMLTPVVADLERRLPKLLEEKSKLWHLLAGHSQKLSVVTVQPDVKCLPWSGQFIIFVPICTVQCLQYVPITIPSNGYRISGTLKANWHGGLKFLLNTSSP